MSDSSVSSVRYCIKGCNRRMTSIKYDTHDSCSICRGKECNINDTCDVCKEWDSKMWDRLASHLIKRAG